MRVNTILSIFPFVALGLTQPTIQATKDRTSPIPYGAFPVPSSSPSATSTTPSGTSIGHAIVENHCSTSIYVWSVGSTIGPETTILPSGRYFETFHADHQAGGIALKISTVPDGLYNHTPLTIFAYNLDDASQVWYDLSDVFGDPFAGHPVSLQPSSPQIFWPNGVQPSGSQVRVVDVSTDLTLSLC